jgi:hypothetical protein
MKSFVSCPIGAAPSASGVVYRDQTKSRQDFSGSGIWRTFEYGRRRSEVITLLAGGSFMESSPAKTSGAGAKKGDQADGGVYRLSGAC